MFLKNICMKILEKLKQKSTEDTQNENRYILTCLYVVHNSFVCSQKINIEPIIKPCKRFIYNIYYIPYGGPVEDYFFE